MDYETRTVEVKYKGLAKSVQLPGWYCRKCGEGVHNGKDLKVTDKALVELKARHEGLLCKDEIRRIRKRLNLTQKDAGLILGGGPRAFQKYESGELLPSRAIVNVLKVLDAMPQALDVLGPK